MGYVDDSSMVRVDFFRPSGKWYCTEGVKWLTYHSRPKGLLTDEAFVQALEAHLQGRLRGMTAVCLEPYHEHSFPLMVKVPEA